MSDVEDLLTEYKIFLPHYSSGRYYTTCPHCSATRKLHHQKLKVLGVTIDGNRVYWGCNHCKWTGPQARGNGATFYDYGERTKIRRGDKSFYWEGSGQCKGDALYRYNEARDAAQAGETICIVEGEKDVDTLWSHGFAATCNAHGAGKWTANHAELLRGWTIVVLNDADSAGYQHAADIVRHCRERAASVRRLELSTFWPDVPVGGDISDWFADAGGNDDWLDRLMAEAPLVNGAETASSEAQPRAELTLVIPTVWEGQPLPQPEWTVRDLIPCHQVALFSGSGGSGKSTIGLHLVTAHVLGKPFLHYDPTPGPALFIDAEDNLAIIHRRLDAILSYYGASYRELGELNILSLHGKDAVLASNKHGRIIATELFGLIEREIRRLRPVQTVIASSADVFAGSEIDRTQVTQFIHMLTGLTLISGSLILICHPAKLDINGVGYSGSTAWFNAVRAQINLKTPKNGDDETAVDGSGLRLLEFRKNQYGPVNTTLTLQWKDGMFLPAATPSAFDDAKANEIFCSILRRYIHDGRNVSAKRQANNYAPRMFKDAPEAAAMKLRDLERAMERLFHDGIIRVDSYDRWGTERIAFSHVTLLGDA